MRTVRSSAALAVGLALLATGCGTVLTSAGVANVHDVSPDPPHVRVAPHGRDDSEHRATRSPDLDITRVSWASLDPTTHLQGGSQIIVTVRVREEARRSNVVAYDVQNRLGYDLSQADVTCSDGVSADTPQCEYSHFANHTATTTFTLNILGLNVANSPNGTLHDTVCVVNEATGTTAACRTIAISPVESD